MSTSTSTRFKTGQKCVRTGNYCFDGYSDGTSTPSPTAEERVIPMDVGDIFPPIRSCEKACWWCKQA